MNEAAPTSRNDAVPGARYVMVGGFLGAGKSTAVLALAERYASRDQRVGLITNDQSVGLVDTTLMRSRGFATQEIAGGCFCCRFDSLVEAADTLAAESAPDVFIAEPVGSCTDLVATVSYPLRRMYGDRYRIAPLSVLVDPVRAERILGLETGRSFSDKVVYVYRKQLAEADLIVINKSDTLDAPRRLRLSNELEKTFPNKTILTVSARTGEGVDAWFTAIESADAPTAPTMAIDYDTYADGEALLGWLNATVRLDTSEPIDGESWMMDLADRIAADLPDDAEIAHLKMTLVADDHAGAVAVLNVVRNDLVAELSQALPEKLRRGTLIVNLRAETDPAALETAVRSSLDTPWQNLTKTDIAIDHLDRFRPGRPTPTWRMTDADTLTPFAPTA